MSDFHQAVADISYHSSDEILAHPHFATARMAFVESTLALYEDDPFLNRLLVEAGRLIIATVILCLHVRYDEADRATWPTVRLLKESMAQFGLSSPRRIEDLVARLVHSRFLEMAVPKTDRRVRILLPTEKLIAHDQDWLAAQYAPLHAMFPDPGYPLAVGRDPVFQRAQRLVAMSFFSLGAHIMASNPAMLIFLNRDAGMMPLIKLVQMASAGEGASEGLSYADLGARFGVSRTHVRNLLQEAEQMELVSLTGRGGRYVRLLPSVLQAFDRFVADGMSGHDLLYQIALSQMKGQPSAK